MTDEVITQLSIFVNNEPGRLASVAAILKECNVNMKECNLAESTEFGILRVIVDNPDEAYEKIKARGVIIKKTDVLGLILNDTPGGLFEAADVLGKTGINIEYGYAYSNNEMAIFFIRIDDPEKAVLALKKAGVRLVKSSEI